MRKSRKKPDPNDIRRISRARRAVILEIIEDALQCELSLKAAWHTGEPVQTEIVSADRALAEFDESGGSFNRIDGNHYRILTGEHRFDIVTKRPHLV
jgi:hypothetical protein